MQVLIPVKRFNQAKTRLAESLNLHDRMQLAEQMLLHVLSELSGANGLDRLIVLSQEPTVPGLCHRFGCEWLSDATFGDGLNQIITSALQVLPPSRGHRALILHADLPLIQRKEVEDLVSCHRVVSRFNEVVLIPDRRGDGTNGLICSLPLLFELQYGVGSCQRHQAAAQAQGLGVTVEQIVGIAWDVDQMADLSGIPQWSRFAQDKRPPLVAERRYF